MKLARSCLELAAGLLACVWAVVLWHAHEHSCMFSESAERRCVVCSLKRCDGDTIHHACGIPVNRRGDGHDEHLQRQQDIAKCVVQRRWLSIDEVSMVSAKLWVAWI